MPTDNETVENVATSYEKGLPTQDLTLKAIQTEDGVKFWGIASGYASRPERVSVKYLILEHIQGELNRVGIKSELNIAGINTETIEYMRRRGMFKDNLAELREIASRRGNLDDTVIGIYAAMNTPV